MDLTIGPIAFFWTADTVRDFYRDLAASPARRVVIGEWVCSKRLPFWQEEIPGAVEALLAAGKDVALSALALVTLCRERRQTADLFDAGIRWKSPIWARCDTCPKGRPFRSAPPSTFITKARWNGWPQRAPRGFACPQNCRCPRSRFWRRQALPRAPPSRFGAMVARRWRSRAGCYHARLHDRAKDSCQFVCGDDPDERDVEPLDGRAFVTVNGVQTLGHAHTTVAGQIADLAGIGVGAIRLSPQAGDFAGVVRLYDDLLRQGGGTDGVSRLQALMPTAAFAAGFLEGAPGLRPVQ